MCSDAPDTSGMNQAAVSNAALSKETLDFYKQVWADSAVDRAQARDTAQKVSAAQLSSMQQNDALSKDYADYNKSTFRPLEQSIVADAQNYDTAERREAAATSAGADVTTQMAAARQAMERRNASMGVNPNSGRAQALSGQASVAEAAAKAGAMNKARKDIEVQGLARKMDAASLGRGLAGNQATSAQIALSAGTQGANTAAMPLAQTQGQVAMMGQGFNTAIQGNQSAGNIYGQMGQIENGANAGGGMAGLGQLMGGGAALYKAFSSKKLKTNKVPLSSKQALKGIAGLKVEGWDYKPGVADSGTHVGPYAEDVQKTFGDEVAPGGEMLDMAKMGELRSSALKELAAKVEEMNSEIAELEGAA